MIRRGELIAYGTPAQLKNDLLGKPLWQVRLAQPLPQPLPSQNGHWHIESQTPLAMSYRAESPEIANPLLLEQLRRIGAQVVELHELPRSLEQVYLKLVEQ